MFRIAVRFLAVFLTVQGLLVTLSGAAAAAPRLQAGENSEETSPASGSTPGEREPRPELSASQLQHTPYQDLPSDFITKWEALLHIRNGVNAIEYSDFYLTGRGNAVIDPERELRATLDYFRRDPEGSCRYPARYYLIYHDLPDSRDCPDFAEYRRNVFVSEVSLILVYEDSSAFVSSMGHTGISIAGDNDAGKKVKYAVTFMGQPRGIADMVYEPMPGNYFLAPFAKFRDSYIVGENRSVKEYRLRTTEEERLWLYLHLFELKDQNVRYRFTVNNCANGSEHLLRVMSRDLEVPDYGSFLTPLEYVRYLKDSGLVSEEESYYTRTDQYYADLGRPVNPEEAPPLVRLSGGYVWSSLYGSGFSLKFMPFFREASEDISASPVLENTDLLSVTLRSYRLRPYISEINFTNKYRYTDVLSPASLTPDLMIRFHGDVTAAHASLYPDLATGLGFSAGSGGLRPFYSVRAGLQIDSGGVNPYLLNTLGVFCTHPVLGRWSLSWRYALSDHEGYRGYRSRVSGTGSKRLTDNLWLELSGNYYRLSDNDRRDKGRLGSRRELLELSGGVALRF